MSNADLIETAHAAAMSATDQGWKILCNDPERLQVFINLGKEMLSSVERGVELLALSGDSDMLLGVVARMLLVVAVEDDRIGKDVNP